MNRAEVWWADIPAVGRRPCLVLTRDGAIPLLRNIVVAPVTSRIRGLPSELLLDEVDGMPRECAVSFDNLHTVPKSVLRERICALRGERLGEACRVLERALGC